MVVGKGGGADAVSEQLWLALFSAAELYGIVHRFQLILAILRSTYFLLDRLIRCQSASFSVE